MSGRVFISHSEKDKTYAQMLLAALEEKGTPCWIAPRDIPPGGSYADAIMRAIKDCACFLLVYTAHSNTSPHVLREVERALKFERNIIPVRFDQSEPSSSLDYLLATVHWLSIDTAATKTAVDRAAGQIAATLSLAPAQPSRSIVEPARTEPPAPPIPATTGTKGAGKYVVLGAIVVLLIGAGIFLGSVMNRNRQSPQVAETNVSPQSQVAVQSVAPTASASPAVIDQVPSAPVDVPLAKTAERNESARQPANTGDSEPEDVLRRYFSYFTERNPAAAYDLFSTGFRSAMSFKKYSAMFSSTREIKPIEISELEKTEGAATIYVRFQEIDANDHSEYWIGPIDFEREKGQWRIKTLGKLQKVPASDVIGDASRQ